MSDFLMDSLLNSSHIAYQKAQQILQRQIPGAFLTKTEVFNQHNIELTQLERTQRQLFGIKNNNYTPFQKNIKTAGEIGEEIDECDSLVISQISQQNVTSPKYVDEELVQPMLATSDQLEESLSHSMKDGKISLLQTPQIK
ncbi:Hypothetical_protein [Hexamita inflata]|uniref:Hypothetical_protein n=1 Tax=Hexamita inflata TaxID=28002 RepID=A0AA86UB74_9EUKA|nr:Hypothetical protein HINF_LOCUS33331 [Hexamita inflata]